MPKPKPVPTNTGHARLLKNNSDNTDPMTSPPAKTERGIMRTLLEPFLKAKGGLVTGSGYVIVFAKTSQTYLLSPRNP